MYHALCIITLCLVAAASAFAGEPAAKPNIIFILADDLGYADLGCYGQDKIKTPNIDRLASEGARFTQFYAGSTVCAPSRCALLTGKHMGHSHIRDNAELKTEGQRPLPENTVTLATVLKKAGYVTGACGKWGLGGAESSGAPNKQGFDFFYGYICQRVAHNFYPTHLWRNETKEFLDGNVPGNVVGKVYAHDLIAEEGLKFIRANKDKPFFLYLPYTIPHLALQVPDDSLSEYKEKFAETPYNGKNGYLPHPTPRAAYAAMVSRMDRDVGRVLALLKELNLDENTLVMFSSDNGPAFKIGGADSAFFKSAGSFRGLKTDLYEGGIRVPLLARWPGRIQPGTLATHVCASWDILPTIAEITGAQAPENLAGISFTPTLFSQQGQKQHNHLYWEYHAKGGSQAVRMGKWKGVRMKVKSNPNGPIELYNLENDEGETKDVAADNPEIVKQMAQIMAQRERSVYPDWNFEK
ncbi:MAG TPA: arylsulfatase [Planctomycetota bacterium]|nr:arylsulfatase [Planctomycetota bacterium]